MMIYVDLGIFEKMCDDGMLLLWLVELSKDIATALAG
jgi:hypothetical protein